MQKELPSVSPKHVNFAKQVAKCHFLKSMTDLMGRRYAELRRESGPFWKALCDPHMPSVRSRHQFLKDLLASLKVFSNVDEKMTAASLDEFSEMERLLKKFEDQVLSPLATAWDLGKNEEKETKRERRAKKAIKKEAQPSCAIVVRQAREMYQEACAELEHITESSLITETECIDKTVTIISIDLARYGHHSKVLDDYEPTSGVVQLNEKIQEMIGHALKQALDPAQVIFRIQDTGDGALVVLDGEPSGKNGEMCSLVFEFAEKFFKSIKSINSGRNEETKMHFRMGASTGRIALTDKKINKKTVVNFRMAGLVIAKAVRLQAAAKTGEFLACEETCKHLPTKNPYDLKEREEVQGKVHEVFTIPARRCKMMDPAPPEAEKNNLPPKPKRRKRK